MKTKEVKVEDKTFTVTEIKYKELTAFADLSKEESAKKIIIVSTGISEEDYDNLNVKEGMAIQKAINELNGLVEDFQNPSVK